MSRRPRVLHVITSLDRGGAEMSLARLVSMPAGIDHVGVATLRGGDTPLAAGIAADGVPVHHLALNARRPHAAWSRWRAVLAAARPDILHAWLIHPALLLSLLPRRLPLVLGIRHSLDALTGEKRSSVAIIRVLAAIGRRADSICYVSETGRRQHEAIGYPAASGIVVPNGFAVAPPPPRSASPLRRMPGLEGAFLFGQVARVHPVKGHDILLRAFATVARARSDTRLVLIGAGTDDAGGTVATLASGLGIADRVLALGERDDVPALLGGLDCLVNPSRSEALPNAVAEAMLAGLPCIATAVGDTATLIGGHGVTVPPGDPDALAAAMLDMAARAPAARAAMGEAARDRVIRHYGLPVMARRYADLYAGLLDDRAILRSTRR